MLAVWMPLLLTRGDLVRVLVCRCEDDGKPMAKPYKFSNQRARELGLEFTPLKKSLYEAVVCMQQKGHLPVISQQQRSYL